MLGNHWRINDYIIQTLNLIKHWNTHTVFPWIMGEIHFCEILRRSKQEWFKKQSCCDTVIEPPVSVIHTKVLKKISTQVPSLKKGRDSVINTALNVNHRGIHEDRETQATLFRNTLKSAAGSSRVCWHQTKKIKTKEFLRQHCMYFTEKPIPWTWEWSILIIKYTNI